MPKSSGQKTTQQDAQTANQTSATGPDGAALTPPAYGMDFLDQSMAAPHGAAPVIQKQAVAGDERPENRTGLPDALKSGIESLSGLSMDDVRVHTSSSKPAELQALAYAQGTDIHVGPGQERHLPHEAWHIVQQKQGRVTPTTKIAKKDVNDDALLEKEADVMGAKANQSSKPIIQNRRSANTHPASIPTIQREPYSMSYPSRDNPARITEGRWAHVRAGQTIGFTALAAGCMAITTVFSNGGGAGVHMALHLPNATQWNPFKNAISGKKIDTVYLDGDMIGENEGWYVKATYNDDFMVDKMETEYSPRSANELATQYGDLGAAVMDGWIKDTEVIQRWFREALGAENVVINTTHGAVSHVCP